MGLHNKVPLLKNTHPSEPQRKKKEKKKQRVGGMWSLRWGHGVDSSQGNDGSRLLFDINWEVLKQKSHYSSRDGTQGTDREKSKDKEEIGW